MENQIIKSIRFVLESAIEGTIAHEGLSGEKLHYYVEDWTKPNPIDYYFERSPESAITRMLWLIEDEFDMRSSCPGYDFHRITITVCKKGEKAIDGKQIVSFWEDRKFHDNDGLFKMCFE